MRFVTFSSDSDPRPRLGAITGDRVTDLASTQGPATLLALIQQGDGGARRARERAEAGDAPTHLVTAIRWHAPIPRPARNVFCLGLNYAAHARESSRARGAETRLPTVPVFFTKATTSVNGPFDDVPVDWTVTSQVDWEVELGVVIGRRGRNIPRERALDHVFGYTVVNDLSARDLQTQHLQWFKGKSLDGSCPIGPAVVTADEFGDPQRKRLQVRVNGITKQDSTTADMIFPVDQIVEWLSKGLTLEPGDIIATGTPEGVGMGRTPQEFLKDGDIVETEVEGVGAMRNRIVTLEHSYSAE
jgi:2-keto-4-pentenoate hydratase/2-oxohepta-3-ene-1,7-dioic acid hydratase in catechol pathway